MKETRMTQYEIDDIKSKRHILKNLDRKNLFHLEFAAIMLIKGFSYTDEKDVQCFKEYREFDYFLEIGKLLNEYMPEKPHFNLLETKVLETTDPLLVPQIYSCAENIASRLKLAHTLIDDYLNGKTNVKGINEYVIKQNKKMLDDCKKILGDRFEKVQ